MTCFKEIKRVSAVFLIILAVTAHAGITIIENTPEQFRFSWELPEIDTSSYTTGGRRVVSLSYDESNTTIGRIGEPAIPGFTFHIGVPQNGTVSISFSPQTTEMLKLSYPPAVVAEQDEKNVAVQSGAMISVVRYGNFRSMRTAEVLLRPVSFDETTGRVTFIRKGSGTIRFPAASYHKLPLSSKSDYENMLRKMVLNYKVASGWRKEGMLHKKKASTFPFTFNNNTYWFRIGDGNDGFNEATTDQNGLVKISAEKIKDLFGTISTAELKLFAAYKGMLPHELPDDGSIPVGVREVPLYRVDHNGNGTFDGNDYVLAYVSESSDWKVMHLRSEWQYNLELDVYDDYRTYWLTTSAGSGATMQTYISGFDDPDTTVSAVRVKRRFHQANARRDGDQGSQKWYLKVMNNQQSSIKYCLSFPGLDKSVEGSLVFSGYAKDGGTVDLLLDDETIGTQAIPNKPLPITSWLGDTLRIDFNDVMGKEKARVDIRYIDVDYQTRLKVTKEKNVLTILPPLSDSSRVVGYNLSVDPGITAYILRVPERDVECELVGIVDGSESSTFQWVDSVVYGVRYVVASGASITEPDSISPFKPPSTSGRHLVRNLRSNSNFTDFLIITHADFLAAADSLAGHKLAIHKNNGGFAHPAVVDVADIYRYFSGGDKDAAAIRNFIGYVQRFWKNSQDLDYVVLVGVGHYDPKQHQTNIVDYLPVFIDDDECYEDFYTRTAPFGSEGEDKPQLAIGRLPCSTIDQAWAMVNKIVRYENPDMADFSEWRNRMLFVADDDMQGERVDQVALSTPHHLSSDRTATVVDTISPSIDIRKVYLFEYEWDQAMQKPGASRALINEINNGVGYINFYGHGADVTWTDEYILTQEMVAGMANAGRNPVVSAFSCSVGKFDVPGSECLSGVLAKADGVGSIASISSTREAYATANENLAKSFYRFFFDTTAVRSIGMALVQGQINTSGSGHRTYAILGDPSVRAVRPSHRISLTLDDDNDTLAALQKVTVSGKMYTPGGNVDKSFGGGKGYLALGLFNASDTAIRKDGGERDVRYVLPGTPVFLGKTSVVNGAFSQTILVPQNLTFDKPGIRLTAYAWNDDGSATGTGYRRDLLFHGSVPPVSIKDSIGPKISIRPVYDNERFSGTNASFTDHITVQTPVTCEVELFDENGIDAAGIGPEEGITLEIVGIVSRQNINSKLQFKNGDYRQGIASIVYEEEVIQPGTYDLVVTARDLIGNLSKAKFTLNVTQYDELTLDHVLNFPNPVRLGKKTRFYCHSNYTSHEYYSANIRLMIKIYTLGGRLLRVFRNARNGEEWDCRDQRGNLLSPDIYLYQVIAEDINQRKTVKSKIMKLVILPPR